MSIKNIQKDGLFKNSYCPYSATAIEAVEEMQDFEGKCFFVKAKVVRDALEKKHP